MGLVQGTCKHLSMFTARNYGQCVKDFHGLCSQDINTGYVYWAEVIVVVIIIIYLYKSGLTKCNRSVIEFIF